MRIIPGVSKAESNGQSHRVLIVGAGPAGLTAAHELSKNGRETLTIEKDPEYVGGIARTVCYRGFRFDIGGHRFFTKNPEIEKWWRSRLGTELIEVVRRSRIFYRGNLLNYPLKAGNVFQKLGPITTCACVLSYLRACLFPIRPERSFADWVSNRFGSRLFGIFFKDYTEKIWGMSCSEISADWAAQRIKDLSLARAALNAIGFKSRKKVIKTLTDRFLYPRLGPGMMWQKTRDEIQTAGGEIRMGEQVIEICCSDHLVHSVITRNGTGACTTYRVSSVLASMPLQELVQALNPQPPADVCEAAARLLYRDFVTVALVIQRSELFPDNWIYIQDRSVQVGRIQNFNNWSRALVPDPNVSCLGLEYFCSKGDAFWTSPDSELVELAKTELSLLGFARPEEIGDACVVRTEKAYPVYYPGYETDIRTIRAHLSALSNLQMIGRNGMHRYNNMDHSMVTGLLAARNILGADFDVWKVNTDAEYLEETTD